MTELEELLNRAAKEFRKKIEDEIEDKEVSISVKGQSKIIEIKKRRMNQVCKEICPTKNDANNFVKHYEDIEKYLPFCSSKKSFSMSKNFAGQILNKHSAEELREMGAQLIPLRDRNDEIFYYQEGGLVYGKKDIKNSGLIKAIRHNEGNYDDEIDEMGYFTYQPPPFQSGFVNYRWNQFLKQKFDVPLFFLAIRWFKIENEISQKMNHVFMITPVTIVSSTEQKNKTTFFKNSNDLENLGKTIHNPIPLKIISVKEAFEIVGDLNILKNDEPVFQNRSRLNNKMENDWSFDNIRSSKRGIQIKKWAQKNRKQCPDGSKCQNKLFEKFPLSEIAFGHIASQKWCDAFKFDIKNHPYNLYLTCKSCNSALNYRFPHKKLQDKINLEEATIGDWVRKYQSDIEKI
jgi:hypothetical protein|tara:strand:- start:191 stop:1399 length:1209 start_codon:yes stop_codon:yes gene_type:complete